MNPPSLLAETVSPKQKYVWLVLEFAPQHYLSMQDNPVIIYGYVDDLEAVSV